MINKLKNYWEIFIIFLLSLTPLIWLKDNQIILGHDSGFRLNYLDHFRNLFYSWSSISNFGVDWTLLKGFLITQAPETFFSWLFNSLATGEKISFILWFFVIGISMYVFINNFFPKKEFWIFRIFSSVFYMYNFFLLQGWFIAERAKFSLFAALPLGLLIIYKLLNKEINLVKGAILFSLIFFFLNLGGSPNLYGSIILVYFITFIYLTFVNYLRDGVREVIYSIKILVGLATAIFLINAYLILPQIYLIVNKYYSSLSSAGGISGILGGESVVNQYASFINLFRLQGIPDWYNNINHPYANYFINNPLLIVLSFIPISTILLGLFLYKRINAKNRNDQLFYLIFILFLVGIVFSAGSHPPLGFLYVFLIEHLPGFAVFRSAFYKFGPAYWFSFIFLTGHLLNLLLLNYVKRKYIYNFVGIFAVIFIIFYHFPYFTANFFEFNKPFTTKVNIPVYVRDASAYVNKNISEESRILILPKLYPDFRADGYDWGFFSLDILPRLSMDRSIVANDNYSPEIISNIYDAIDKKNENEFLKLTGLAGINKILWRDDVLYIDEITTSKDLLHEKNNLENFKSISLEKRFSKWSVYNIKSENYLPKFYFPKIVNYSISGSDSLRYLLGQKEDLRSSVILSEVFPEEKLKKVIDKIYIQPNCILCKDNEFEEFKNKIDMPEARLLPNSIFYFLVSRKENLLTDRYANYPAQRVDADLSFANKRIAEIFGIVFKEDFNQASKFSYIESTINNYKSIIEDALLETNKLSQIEKNNYLIRLLGYLHAQRKFLDKLHFRGDFSEKSYESLISFIDKNILNIGKTVWISSSQNDKRLFFSVIDKDKYSIEFLGEEKLPEKVILDGSELKNTNGIILDLGEHKLELIYKPIENLLEPNQLDEKEFSLNNQEKRIFTTKNIIPSEKYNLTFEYKIIDGDNSLLSISSQKNGFSSVKFNLKRDTEWKSYSHEFTSNIVDADFFLQNLSQEINTTAFRNFSLTKTFIPKVFFTKNINNSIKLPELKFRKINQTEYAINVINADNSFFLSFGESFDRGWKVYKLEKDTNDFTKSWKTFLKKSINEENHFKMNGYSNGWLIEEKGNYDLLVIFEPQKYFYVGLGVSAVTLVTFIYMFLRLRRRNE